MSNIEKRILLAQNDNTQLESLLLDYLPFIKKQLATIQIFVLEYDDILSIAMLTFVNCVMQYSENRGSFINFASLSIRNRIIDEARKDKKNYLKIVPLINNTEEMINQSPEEKASVNQYSKDQERQRLIEEIDVFSAELMSFGVTFEELPNICPKQERSRNQCISLARTIVQDKSLKDNLTKNNKISQLELSKRFNISPKTIEKHRKYIVTVAILLMGDYPCIRTFLPQYKEVKT